MKVKILGISQTNFVNDKGERIAGTSLFIAYPKDNVTGLAAEKRFLNESFELPKGLTFEAGKDVNMYFDPKGKIESILPM